jgi:hypothetical protein
MKGPLLWPPTVNAIFFYVLLGGIKENAEGMKEL